MTCSQRNVYASLLLVFAGVSTAIGDELLIHKVLQWGDIIQSKNKDEQSISVEAQLPDEAVIGWQGNKLGIHTRSTNLTNSGAGVWNGSSFQLYGAPDWPYPGFTHPQPNREGNPPEEPFVNSFRALGLLPSGEIAYAGRMEDEATFAPEVFWNEVGKADGNTFSSLLQTSIGFHAFFFELAPGGDGLFSEDPELESGKWIWWLFDDSRITIWERDQPAPGLPDLNTTFQFDRYRHPNDPGRPFTKSRHIIGAGSVSPDGTGINSFGAYFLVDPGGNKEFLFRDDGNPSPAVEGVAEAGTFGVSHLDMNENLDIAMTAILRVEGETPRASVWLRRFGGELQLVALVGVPVQTVGSTEPTTFTSFRGVPWLDDSGNLYFDAEVEGSEDYTIWKYRAEDDLFEPVGPAVGSPMPGVEGAVLLSAQIRSMNASGRMVAYMEGLSMGVLPIRGYYLQTAEGDWCPFLLNGEVLVPGDPQTLSSNSIQAPIISENNQVAFTARIENLPTVFTVRIASEVQPEGDQYIWSGGAGTNDWHTVANGRSNWVDSVGTPWPTPPGSGARDEEVIIGPGFVVELNQPAWVNSILMEDGGNSGLVINSELGFESLIRVPFLSELTLTSGKLESAAGVLEMKGSLFKKSAGSFNMDLAILQLQGEEFQMEEGILNVRNGETWFDGSTFTQTGGTLTFQDEVTRLLGDANELAVSAGNLSLASKQVSLESDTTMSAENEDSKIVIGQKAADAQLSFVAEGEGEIRTLEIQGKGKFEFRSPFILTETARLESQLTGFIDPLVINLIEGKTIEVRDRTFINQGNMRIAGGGITGKFENTGTVTVEAEDPDGVIKIECQNKGQFNIRSDVEYIHEFAQRNVPGEFGGINPYDTPTGVRLWNASIRPVAEGTGVLIFEGGTELYVEEGDNLLKFSESDENLFAAGLRLSEGANLHLKNAQLGHSSGGFTESKEWRIPENATLTLEDTTCDLLRVTGQGEVIVNGYLDSKYEGDDLHYSSPRGVRFGGRFYGSSEPPKFPAVILETEVVRLEDVEIKATAAMAANTVLFSIRPRSELNYETLEEEIKPGETVELEGVSIGPQAQLHLGNRNFRSSSPITIDGVLYLDGVLELGDDVLSNIEDPMRGPRKYGLVVDTYGDLTFSGNVEEPILVGPLLEVYSSKPIVVEAGSVIQIAETDAFDGPTGELKKGVWKIEPTGQLIFLGGALLGPPYTDIEIINRAAKLTVSSPAEGRFSVNGFPLRNSNLQNFGELTLDGAILDFQGNTLFNEPKSKLILKNGGKIIGNFSDVVEDVEGVLNLAQLNGAVDISGNAEINGALGVGASPGRGVIGGDLTLSQTSQVHIEIGGTEGGVSYDQVEVGGTATLNGKLILYPWNDYEIIPGEEFEFLQAGTLNGNFTEIDQSRLGRNVRLDFAVGESGLAATAMPLTIASYADWRAAFFTQSDAADDLVSGPDADPDGDGMSNRFEYLVDGNPNISEGSPVTFTLAETDIPNVYSVQASFDWVSAVTDEAWLFEISDNLQTWSEVSVTELSQTSNGDYNTSVVDFDAPIDASERTFIRLNASEVVP